MMTAIALDDERPALEVLDVFCRRLNFIDLQQTFTRTNQARQYLETQPVALLFLDINMPAESGIGFYRSIQDTLASPPMVIFTTAYGQYAVESYDLQAVDYLLKPFTFARFQQAVQKAHDRFDRRNSATSIATPSLYLQVDYGLVKVDLADIQFIEGLDNYLKIHLQGRTPLVVRMTLKAMTDQLPTADFLRVHRSYIVSLHRIESVRNKLLTVGGEEIPLGSRYEADFNARFLK